MRKAITILFVSFVVSVRAEEFNWSWEKTAAAPSEKVTGGAAVTGGVQSAGLPGAAARAGKASAPVQVAADGSVPDSADRAPAAAAPAPAPAPGEGFSWAWEKDKAKTGTGKERAGESVKRGTGEAAMPVPAGVPVADLPKAVQQAETTVVPPEIENLSGAVPKSDADSRKPSTVAVQPATVPAAHPNSPSSPVVMPGASAQAVQPGGTIAVKEETRSAGTAASRAYDELVKENTDLRKKIIETRQDKDVVRLENERLAREVKDLERRIADSTVQIKDIGRQRESLGSTPGKRREFESRLVKAEQERILLGSQLILLQKQIAERDNEQAARPAVDTAAASGVSRPADSIKPGSDLYRKLEGDNLLLRQKLAELDVDRQKAIKARDETEQREKLASEETRRALDAQKQMKDKLDEARSTDRKQKRMMVDMAERIPDMEKEVNALQKKLSEKDVTLKEKDRNLEIMASEVQQRENRIRKAEKMVELMEQAQRDVNQVSDSEKRDMHYNMATVYGQVGRYRDAEREYLHALRLDPADADVHYNLGILYDENLNEKPKAAMHYRRYLKLRPNSSDVDTVKNWLMNIDMR